MVIKDESMLRKMHENYDEEIEIIEKVFEYFHKLVNENLTDYLADNYRVVHRKNHLFSSQLKEIYFSDGTNPNYNVNLAYNYEKDGSIFQLSVNSKSVINNLLPGCPFDNICITPATNKANFSIGDRCAVNIGYTYNAGNYILTSYNANFDILRTIM